MTDPATDPRAWTQTLTGRALVFAEPVVEREHLFSEIAHGLSLTNRFAGQTAMPISVAQHSVHMAEAALDETGDPELAAFCLLHDAHEAYFGDITSPTQAAIGEAMASAAIEAGLAPLTAEALRSRFKAGVARVKRTLDKAIVEAAGYRHTRFEARRAEIHLFDIRALRTERDLLKPAAPRPWHPAIESARRLVYRQNPKLKCWAWPEAEDRYRAALETFCPSPALAA